MTPHVLAAYGLRVACPLALPGTVADARAADVTVVLRADVAELEAAWSGLGPAPEVARRQVDGHRLAYHRGVDGDTLLRWDGGGAWLLDAARATVLAHSPADPPTPAWQRVLLDSVLGSVALGRGVEALHAGAVETPSGAVAVLGASGAGKTSLLAALLERGHPLVADDVLALTDVAGAPAAHPGPPVLSLAGVPADTVGVPIAQLGDETWVHARRVATGPVPLRALVVLDRTADGPARPELVAEAQPFGALYAHLLPGAADDAARFGRIGTLAERVPVLRLRARADGASPAQLATLVEAA